MAQRRASLRARTTRGVMWTTIQKWFVRLTGFFTVALLARILGPEDFGIVAAASTITPLLYLLSDLGFSVYIVQVKHATQEVLSSAFWFSVSAGAVFATLLGFSAVFLSQAFQVDGLRAVLPVMAAAVFLVALGSVPMALLRRRMEFRRLALQSGLAAVLGQASAVISALAGWGVWALVVQLLVVQLVTTLCAWVSATWRPTLSLSFQEIRNMFGFGLKVVGAEFVGLARLWIETAVIAAALGVVGLGYLNIAQRLIQVTQDLSISAITPVTTVAFSKIRASYDRVVGAYMKVMEVTYAISVPLAALLFVASPYIIPLVFGPGWTRSMLPAHLYAVGSFMVVGAVVDQGFFLGTGRPGRWLAYAVVIDLATALGTIAFVRFGLVAVAGWFAGVAIVASLARIYLVSRTLKAKLRLVVRPFVGGAVAMVATSLAALAISWASAPLPGLVAIVIAAGVVLAIYAMLFSWCFPRVRAYLMEMKWRRWRAPSSVKFRPEDPSHNVDRGVTP